MPYYTIVLLIAIPAIGLFFGLMTGAIASNKGRSAAWFWMGFFLDIVGLIVVICLPNLNNKKPPVASNNDEKTELLHKLLSEGKITIEEYDQLRNK